MNAVHAVLRSRRFNRFVPWLSGLVLAAGVVAVLVTVVGNTGRSYNAPLTNKPAVVPKVERSVPVPKEARLVAGKFVLTAVARQNLAEAWAITAPSLKRGYTLAQWETGNIPVVPYPADAIGIAPFKVDYSYPDRILLEVALLPKKGHDIKPQDFFIGLHAYGTGRHKRWLVDYWAPRGAAQVPRNPVD